MRNSFSIPPSTSQIEAGCSICDNSHRESSDDYSRVIVRLTDRSRIAVCTHNLQWILQRRENYRGGAWRGFRYFRTRKALIEACGRLDFLSNTTVAKLREILPQNFNNRNVLNEKVRE